MIAHGFFILQFVQSETSEVVPKKQPTNSTSSNSKRAQLRLQDKGLQEVVDNGMCLSMHQPWASLLVAGIKMYVFMLFTKGLLFIFTITKGKVKM